VRVVQVVVEGEKAVCIEVDGQWFRTKYGDTRSLIEDDERGLEALEEASRNGRPVNSGRMVAPITNPSKIFGSGVNYRRHGDEDPDYDPPDEILWDFFMVPSSIIGSGEPIVIPPADDVIKRLPSGTAKFSEFGFAVDYEVELAVVIGRRAKNVAEADARDYIWGYTIINDVSARSVQFHNQQWDLGKNFDTFCPMGPCIVTRDELAEIGSIKIESLVNGELRQSAFIHEQLVSPAKSIEWLSSIITLEPGDILSTGTPSGTGTFMSPPRFLVPGDVVECRATNIGKLINPVVAGTARTYAKMQRR
jgi:2-keto-4-pentenoate hydratase/2-oxohepta-3-ene-1,7-dioic acid hydratase in catechol pathway